MEQPLGPKLRELREAADISLRELAKKLDVSAPFLSDVEWGRRHPSDRVLSALAKFFKLSVDELKRHDSRAPLAELKMLAAADPRLGFAFRTAINDVKAGKITAEELLNRVRGQKKK